MSSTLAIIPARSGSKGIKNKNIKIFNGKPLISWTINQAITEIGASNVIVSTDSDQILNIAKDYGHKYTYKRPDTLATDNALTEPTMEHVIKWYIQNISTPKYVMLLQPTSPIRFIGRIQETIDYIKKRNLDSLVSVVKDHSFFWKNPKYPMPTYNPLKRPRRQDVSLENINFRENGSIYISKLEKFLESSCRISGKIGLFEMEQIESYEIDTKVDWIINETLMKALS